MRAHRLGQTGQRQPPCRLKRALRLCSSRLHQHCPQATLYQRPSVQRAAAAVSEVAYATTTRLQQRGTLAPPAPINIRSLSSLDLQEAVGTTSASSIAYELIQGPLARWTRPAPGQAPPTAVLVHGIMGNRRNLHSFARMIVQDFPTWQILVVDLRCHGESASLLNRPNGPHNVASAARDVLQVVNQLKLFPTMLIGHSFGGKVVMSMVQQFGRSSLPRPVQVWALDSLPGEVRAGRVDGSQRPCQLIATLRSIQLPIAGRHVVIDALLQQGWSEDIARWAASNLRPLPAQYHSNGNGHSSVPGGLGWSVDLQGIAEMYRSYEETSLWPLLEAPPQGLKVDFVKAEASNFKWGGDDEARIRALGHGVHLLRDAGHWVHTDNPHGLLDIIAPTFGVRQSLHDTPAYNN